MKQLKKMLKFLILLLILISVVSVVSASENITSYEMDTNSNDNIITKEIENTPSENITSYEMDTNSNDNIITKEIENTPSEILKMDNAQNDVLEGYYKKFTTVHNYCKYSTTTYDIDLSKETISYPIIKVYVKSSNNLVTEGNVKFEVNGKSYTSKVYAGYASLTGNKVFSNLGTYTIKATYLGSFNYYNSSTTFKYILNGKTTISIDDVQVNKGQSITIKPKVTPTLYSKYNGGNILLNINSHTYILNSSQKSLTLNLKPGYYYCSAEYGTNPYYVKSSDKFKIKVIEEPLIVAQDYYITVLGEKYTLNIYVVNSEGNAISGGYIYLNDSYTKVSNGIAQFTINPKDIAFDYYDVKYVPSEKYYKTVTINNAFAVATISPTKLTIKSLNTAIGTKLNNVKYTITDALNNKISPSGYFLINGKKYNSLTDFKTPKKRGTYKYTITFVPDLILYRNSTATLKIVNKFKTSIKVKSIRGYENKKVKITAIIKDKLGKNIKKGTVTFKINSKTYKAKVKNGKAVKTIKIPKPSSRDVFYYYGYKKGKDILTAEYIPKTYKCSAVFNGNSKYLKSSSTFKVTSKKKSAYLKHYTQSQPPSKSSSGTKKTTKKKISKSYGFTPIYHKPIPDLNVNLFKTEPSFNTNIKLSDIIITY